MMGKRYNPVVPLPPEKRVNTPRLPLLQPARTTTSAWLRHHARAAAPTQQTARPTRSRGFSSRRVSLPRNVRTALMQYQLTDFARCVLDEGDLRVCVAQNDLRLRLGVESKARLIRTLGEKRCSFLRDGNAEIGTDLIRSGESLELRSIESDLGTRAGRRRREVERNLWLEQMECDVIGDHVGVGKQDHSARARLGESDEWPRCTNSPVGPCRGRREYLHHVPSRYD